MKTSLNPPVSTTTKPATDAEMQAALKAQGDIPEHIAIIMDGNGRWAKKRGKMRVFGHYEGVESVRDITEACAQLGVKYLTLYTFSTENWNRPSEEVKALMTLLVHTLKRERKTLNDNGIRLASIGDVNRLPEACRREFADCSSETEHNERMTLILALSYGGRWEIVNAAREVAAQVQAGTLNPEDITEEVLEKHLSTANYPDPDLLIRSGGEHRISNFLLWQIAYSELYVTDVFWPAFRRESLYEAISNFQQRDRRFGKVK